MKTVLIKFEYMKKYFALIILLAGFSYWLNLKYKDYQEQLILMENFKNLYPYFNSLNTFNYIYVTGKMPDMQYYTEEVIPYYNMMDSLLKTDDYKNFHVPLIKESEYAIKIDTINYSVLFYSFLPSGKDSRLKDTIFHKSSGNTFHDKKPYSFWQSLWKNYNFVIENHKFKICPEGNPFVYALKSKKNSGHKHFSIIRSRSKFISKVNKLISEAGLAPVREFPHFLKDSTGWVKVSANKYVRSFVYGARKKEIYSYCPDLPARPDHDKLKKLTKLFSEKYPDLEFLRFPLEIDSTKVTYKLEKVLPKR